MIIPEPIKKIISEIDARGFKAYAVGGCVRDSLRGIAPSDWDLCSSALPQDLMVIFGDSAIPTGLKHGTVTVNSNNIKAEVTTFRRDGIYSDRRHPDSVEFSLSIHDDLSRRDFTINAIACDINGVIIDPFHGRDDIEQEIIRCVGDPDRRFSEDALRMFRGLRFSAATGFSIEEHTLSAIYKNAPLAAEIAPERIRVELEKLILSTTLAPLVAVFDSGLMDSFCLRIARFPFEAMKALPAEARLRWAALCALIESAGAANTTDFLEKLRLDKHSVRICAAGVATAFSSPTDKIQWKKALAHIGEEACHCAAAAAFVLGNESAFETLNATLASGECWSLKQLAVDGNDLLKLSYAGKDVGGILSALLNHVIENPSDNKKELLLKIVNGAG